MGKATLAIVLSLFSAVSVTPAFAAPNSPPTLAVAVSGLDLLGSRGQIVVERRIAAAAEAVCGQAPSTTLFLPAPIVRCRKQAVLQARQQLAALTAGRRAMLASRTASIGK